MLSRKNIKVNNTLPPEYIILDIGELVKTLIANVHFFSNLSREKDLIIKFIMDSLINEHDGQYQLDYNCLEIFEKAIGTERETEVLQAANHIVAFGEKLYSDLRKLGVYKDGKLFYEFAEWVDKDIMLARLDVLHDDYPRLNKLVGIGKWP